MGGLRWWGHINREHLQCSLHRCHPCPRWTRTLLQCHLRPCSRDRPSPHLSTTRSQPTPASPRYLSPLREGSGSGWRLVVPSRTLGFSRSGQGTRMSRSARGTGKAGPASVRSIITALCMGPSTSERKGPLDPEPCPPPSSSSTFVAIFPTFLPFFQSPDFHKEDRDNKNTAA